MAMLDRKTNTMCELAITFVKNMRKIDLSRHLNDCHFRHIGRINNVMLSALPAARRVPREKTI